MTAADPVAVNEGGSATYTVVLDTQPIANVVIYPSSVLGNAAFTAQPASLTFTPDNWQTAQTVTVSAAQDDNTDNEHGWSSATGSAQPPSPHTPGS